MKTILTLLVALLLTVTLSSCRDDDHPATETVTITVRHQVNGQPLQVDQTYTSPAGDTYTVEKFRFYLSNVKLISEDGRTVYEEPHSYHLITLGGKSSFTLEQVPVATYARVEFAIGVDAAHNHSIDQHGDLDPSNDMVWDWDTGYKFMSLEGRYTGNTKSGGLVFHIGEDTNYAVFALKLPQPLNLRQRPGKEIRIVTELNELFQQPHQIDFDEINTAMGGANARKIMENYSIGFFRAETGE